MKKGLIFATTLAMALGVGVAVGAHQKAAEVKAEGETTLYCKMQYEWWKADGAAIAVNYWGGSNPSTFPGIRGVSVETDIWEFTVPNDSTGFQFVRVNGSGDIANWGAKTVDLKFSDAGENNLFTITNSTESWGDPGCNGTWSKYVKPAPDVPEEDGYYVVGTKSNWKFAGATKLAAGTDGNIAQLKGYHAEDGEEFKIRGYFDGVDTWYSEAGADTGDNYVVPEETTIDIYLNSEYKLYVYVPEDVPAEEGYYIQGLFSSNPCWRYEHGEKMTQYSQSGNVAYTMNFTLAVGDKLRVRSYFDDRDVKDQWADVDNEDDEEHTGVKDGNDFRITVAGSYDVYAKYVGDVFKFYVAHHKDSYSVTLKGVLFEGKAKLDGLVELGEHRAYKDETFNVVAPSYYPEIYSYRGAFVDASCSTAYTPTVLSEAKTLYLKYTKLGYYITGDANYAGSEALAWNIDGASYLSTECNDPNNMFEGSVLIPDSASTAPVSVKPLQYIGGNDHYWSAVAYELGEEYSFCHIDKENPDEESRSNLVFTKGGLFAVYVNKEYKVYLSEGAQAFYSDFLSKTADVCDADGKTTDKASLKARWSNFEIAFNSLSAAEKATIKAVGEDYVYNEKDTDDLHKTVGRYNYIIHKYGTGAEGFKDFIFDQELAPTARYGELSGLEIIDNNTLIVLISIAAVSALAFTTLLVFKKKKQK